MSALQPSEMPTPGSIKAAAAAAAAATTTTTTTSATTLTLIVATTPITRAHGSSNSNPSSSSLLGIGLNGTLPWPRIKSDMAFFARVTTRPPPALPGLLSSPDLSGKVNAIIMGRKTYYSLPKSLRPLKGRLSVIITRDGTGSVADEVARDLARQREKERNAKNIESNNTQNLENNNVNGSNGSLGTAEDKRDAFVSHSLEQAIDLLLARQRREGEDAGLGHIFVIGGGEIYNSALKLPSSPSADVLHGNNNIVLRILMTRVKKTKEGEEFDCDTFFPLTEEDLSKEWREVGTEEVEAWVGERVPSDWVEEGEVATKIMGYERVV